MVITVFYLDFTFLYAHAVSNLFFAVGIVIKYENMQLKTALHQASLVLSLASKATKYVKELFEAPDVRKKIFAIEALFFNHH